MAGLAVCAAERDSDGGPFRLVELAGEADLTCQQLKDVLDAEVAAGPLLLVVDLSRLTFMDSWALNAVLTAGRRLAVAGGAMALASPSGEVSRLLELTGANTLVSVYGSVREAASR